MHPLEGGREGAFFVEPAGDGVLLAVVVPQEEIVFVQACLEAHDGLAAVRTVTELPERRGTLLAVYTTRGMVKTCMQVLQRFTETSQLRWALPGEIPPEFSNDGTDWIQDGESKET